MVYSLGLERSDFYIYIFFLCLLVSFYWLNIDCFVQEIGVCYAFVEFEDILGVQNALKVWTTLNLFIICLCSLGTNFVV